MSLTLPATPMQIPNASCEVLQQFYRHHYLVLIASMAACLQINSKANCILQGHSACNGCFVPTWVKKMQIEVLSATSVRST